MYNYGNDLVYVMQTKGFQESNRVDFFPKKYRLSNIDTTNRLLATLEDLKVEFIPSTLHPVVNFDHGISFNIAICKMKQLFGPVISKASEILTSASVPRVEPNAAPRVTNYNSSTTNINRQPRI